MKYFILLPALLGASVLALPIDQIPGSKDTLESVKVGKRMTITMGGDDSGYSGDIGGTDTAQTSGGGDLSSYLTGGDSQYSQPGSTTTGIDLLSGSGQQSNSQGADSLTSMLQGGSQNNGQSTSSTNPGSTGTQGTGINIVYGNGQNAYGTNGQNGVNAQNGQSSVISNGGTATNGATNGGATQIANGGTSNGGATTITNGGTITFDGQNFKYTNGNGNSQSSQVKQNTGTNYQGGQITQTNGGSTKSSGQTAGGQTTQTNGGTTQNLGQQTGGQQTGNTGSYNQNTGSSSGTSSSKQAPSTGAGEWCDESNYKDDILRAHNDMRAKHGVEPLTWDSTLTKFAQDSNNSPGGACFQGHTTQQLLIQANYGENILGNSTWGPYDMVLYQWYYNEEPLYDYNAGYSNSATGHFTQLVWKSTTKVGCAAGYCNNMWNFKCNYSPAGNVGGQYQSNVPTKQGGSSSNTGNSNSYGNAANTGTAGNSGISGTTGNAGNYGNSGTAGNYGSGGLGGLMGGLGGLFSGLGGGYKKH